MPTPQAAASCRHGGALGASGFLRLRVPCPHNDPRITIHYGVRVALQLRDPIPTPLEYLQFLLRHPASFLKGEQLRPKLIEGYKALGRHLLEPGTLTIRFCDLLGPYLGLTARISLQALAFFLYQRRQTPP